jgi:excisionase family DNA binding protein
VTSGDALARALDALLAVPEQLADIRERLARLEATQGPRPVPTPTERPEDLLTTQEAARVASVRAATVSEWARSGRLPASKPAGSRQYRIRRADLQAFLRGHAGDGDLEATACRIATSGRGP